MQAQINMDSFDNNLRPSVALFVMAAMSRSGNSKRGNEEWGMVGT